MKNQLFSMSLLVTLAFAAASCEKEEAVGYEKLPAAGQEFLNEHFAGLEVTGVIREKEGLKGREYEARLKNGVTVKFDKDGNWEDVDAPGNTALPTSFILPPIVTYVEAEYPEAGINDIDKERHGFDIELTSGLDLEFDTEGNFVRIDP